jgi:Gly-Xaa carboxypeptidase
MSKEDHLLPSSLKLRYRKSSYSLLVFVGLIAILCYTFSTFWPQCHELLSITKHNHVDTCPQVDVLVPRKNGALWTGLGQVYGTEAFMIKASDWLAGAVRVP